MVKTGNKGEKSNMVKKRKYLNRFAVFFFAFMLFFTLFSGQMREQTTPKVVTMRAREKEFPVVIYLEDGTEYTTWERKLAVPEYVLSFTGNVWGDLAEDLMGELEMEFTGAGEMANVFVLEETEEGFFVRGRMVKLGAKADGWFEVESGVDKKDKVVYAADRKLEEGMKVHLVEPGK